MILRAQKLVNEFAQKYGGQGPDGISVARSLLSRAFVSVTSSSSIEGAQTNRTERDDDLASVVQTAARNLPPSFLGWVPPGASRTPPIRILSVGGSAAAGVGNYRGQAYSMVMERVLERLRERADAEDPTHPEPVRVYHASVPDEEELPIVWCFLSQFDDDNLPTWIVWDYPMDDTSSSMAKLEVFLRTVATRWRAASKSRPPLLVFRSMNARARSLLQYYETIIPDVLLLDSALAAEPMLGVEARTRPSGFADWSSFSGRVADAESFELLSVQHHEWIAGLLTMQLLAGLAYNALLPEGERGSGLKLQEVSGRQALVAPLPTPKYVPTDRLWSSLVLGEHAASLKCFSSYTLIPYNAKGNKLEATPDSEEMNEGNFALLTVTSANRAREPNHLNHLVTGGAVTTRMENLLLPQTSSYSQGWVLDLDLPSKRAKQRTAPDFLGFEDWKTAYHGTAASPPLALSLPKATQRLWLCESSSVSSPTSGNADESGGCSLLRDVALRVNGVPVDRVDVVETVTAFEKRPCVVVPITDAGSRNGTHDSSWDDFLEVTLQVTGSRMPNRRAPCSLAHVLYV